MKNIKFPVYFVTGVLLVYTIMANLQLFPKLVVAIFAVSPFLVIWMAYRILKDGVESDYTFNDRFYDDLDYQPIKDKE
ncbi:MAG: hypothetical protein MUC81_10655 [Bacteroidia bacterium]|nr:hypothetical protein [Bacteroidia bacterium]